MPTPLMGAEFTVNATTAGAQLYPTVAAMADGRFAIAWHVSASLGTFSFYGADGTRLRSEENGISLTTSLDNRIEAHGTADNALLLAYQHDFPSGTIEIYTQRYAGFAENGTYSGLATLNMSDRAGTDSHPFLASAPGTFFTGFVAGAGQLVVASRSLSSSSTTAVDPPGAQDQLEGYAAGETFVLAYRDLSSGNVVLHPMFGSATAVAGAGSHPHLADLGDGGCVVTWVGTAGTVLYRIFDLAQTGPVARTAALPVMSGGLGLSQPHVATLKDGRFIIVWADDESSGGFYSKIVYGRLFNPDGSADSAAFVIDDFFSDQPVATGAPRAAVLADGRIVVTWQDGEAASSDISARILDPRTEGVYLAGTGLADDLVGTAFDDTVIGGDGSDKVSGRGGADTLVGGTGNDHLRGDAGNDVLKGQAGNDLLVGGADSDQLYGGFGADTLNGGDAIDYARYDDANYGDLVVSLANPAQNTGAAAGDTYVSIEGIIGGAGNDLIGGNAFVNYLYGLGGNDILAGNGGNDTLVGGPGQDAFVFNTALDPVSNVDRIADFTVADDTIWLARSVFSAIPSLGTLPSPRFVIGAAASDANHRIVYNSATGALLYDPDGSGAGAAIKFAQLSAGLAMTAADFLVI